MPPIFKPHISITSLFYGGVTLLVLLLLVLGYKYIDPLPKKVVIATGATNSLYSKHAERYAKFFASYGIELEILETNGSLDNLNLLSGDNGVDAAFLQSGIASPEDHPELHSLGGLYYEPLWVFFNVNQPISKAREVRGKRVSIGKKGSGTHFLFNDILSRNHINKKNTSIFNMSIDEAIPALLDGSLDVLCISTGINFEAIKEMVHQGENVQLLSFPRARAYSRSRHHYTQLTLPQGAFDLATNKPSRDVNLIASTANLVVKDGIHPAVEYLFLLAANDIHQQGDLLSSPGQFPNTQTLLFPLSDEAKTFYVKGPPFLVRYLPFRLAVTFERLAILLIPLLVVLYPLLKIFPTLVRWQFRRRIYRWYKHLNTIDQSSQIVTDTEEAIKCLSMLKRLDKKVAKISIPKAYVDYKYTLRLHISLIEKKLKKFIVQLDRKSNFPLRCHKTSPREKSRNTSKYNCLRKQIERQPDS